MLQRQFFFLFFLLQMVLSLDSEAQRLIPYRKGNLWGYADSNGTLVIGPKFESADMEYYGLLVVKLNGKWGVINPKGDCIIKPEYRQFNFYNADTIGGLIIAQTESSGYELFDRRGKLLKDHVTSVVYPSKGPNHHIQIGEEFGVINKSGKWLLKPSKNWSQVSEGGYYQLIKNGKARYYNPAGKMIFKRRLLSGEKFENGYARVTYLKKNWWDLVPAMFRKSYSIEGSYRGEENYTKLKLIAKITKTVTNLIDGNGRLFMPDGYHTRYTWVTNGLLIVSGTKGYGILDSLGRFLVKPEYEEINIDRGNYFLLKQGEKLGMVLPITRRVIPPEFSEIKSFTGRIFIVRKEDKYNLLDTSGKIVFEKWLDWADNNYTQAFAAGAGSRLYWINEEGLVVLEKDTSEYTWAYPFNSGLSVAYKKDWCCLIDSIGKKISSTIKAHFYWAGPGMYRVVAKNNVFNGTGIMNKEGRFLIDTIYKYAGMTTKKTHLLVHDGNLWGLYDLQGNKRLEMEYTTIMHLESGSFALIKPNPEYKAQPTQVIGDTETKNRGGEVQENLYYLAAPSGKIIRELKECPNTSANFFYVKEENGYIRMDGKEFFED